MTSRTFESVLRAAVFTLLPSAALAAEPEAASGAAADDAAPATAPAPESAESAAAEPEPAPAPSAAPAPVVEPVAAADPVATPSPAADGVAEEPNVEGVGAFLIGAGLFDWSPLNDRLKAAGYETVDNPVVLLGGEARAILPSGFVIGGRGFAIVTADGEGPGNFTRDFSGGLGMAEFGYAFVHTEPVLLTLGAGIGGYGLSLEISEHDNVDFDDVLSNPERSASLSTSGVLAAATLAFDSRIPLSKANAKGHRGFFNIGVRIGGLYGPTLEDWDLSFSRQATGSPDVPLAGGYALLALGFGGGRGQPEQ